MSGIQGSTTISSWGGTTNIQGKSMSIEQRMQLVLLDTTQMHQTSLEDQVKDMENRNKWVADANKVLGELRASRPPNTTDVPNFPASALQFGKDNGIFINGDNIGNQGEFDQAIANMKSAIDTASSSSQLEMVRLGSTQTKLGQAWDMLTNSNKKFSDTQSNAIRG
jgi:hypothetical protein